MQTWWKEYIKFENDEKLIFKQKSEEIWYTSYQNDLST